MSNAFSIAHVTPKNEMPSSIKKDFLVAFQEMTAEPEVQHIILAARSMQKRSRKIWNPFGDKVTFTNYMGLVAMYEDTTAKNGALALDLGLKAGLLVRNPDGKYVSGTDVDAR